jgi:hypothetical protein
VRHTALAGLAILLGGCFSGAAFAAIRAWLDEDERRCADWCALDIDVQCGGDDREHATCEAACRASESGACAEDHERMHACEAALTCPDYRLRNAKGSTCETLRAAADACAAAP